ncbi:hypothetical protein J2809_002115 [Arthrobacter pascens]|uniref:hypothetical protein n=1 Tax=Arthrobacter pascens TaxID=1677 RepID=UPI0028678F6F|nr:hypothetical protein [Arthrobacter pascens]MDR6557755.1 hypothetical protein [Arthrobacter pascens]
MTTGAGRDGNKYGWQSWPPDSLDGMPPKRRRLAGWAVFWLLLLGSLLGSVFEAVGVVQPWRSLFVLAVLAAVVVPLIRAAVLETRQLRAEGIEMPSYPVTRKSLISAAVITAVLWIINGVAVAMNQDQFVFPLLPIAATAWLAFQVHRWNSK